MYASTLTVHLCLCVCVFDAGKVAERLGPGHTVVTMMCDGAHRYMSRLFSKKWLESKGLLASIPADCAHLVTLP